jgi:hypothetical protein
VALLQAHREIQVVTPRTLADFHGQVLVFPEVSTLRDAEKRASKAFVDRGGRLIALGQNATGIPESKTTVLRTDPMRDFYQALERDFADASRNPPEQFLDAIGSKGGITLDAPPTVAANYGLVNGTPHVYLVNFTGLIPSKVAVPSTVNGIRVTIPASQGSALTFLPFLGEKQLLRGEKKGDNVEFVLPSLERGAVIWVGDKN